MNIQVVHKESLFYAQIDGLYTAQEIQNIKKELIFLETLKQDSSKTHTANENGELLKKGHGIFVDDIYAKREHSLILKTNRKLFNPDIINELVKHNCFFGHVAYSTSDCTLINFYGAGDHYKTHRDTSIFTAVTFFSIGNFSGGEFSFVDHGIQILPVEGRVVLFPGCVMHKADEVIAEPNNYRVTMAQFINYKYSE